MNLAPAKLKTCNLYDGICMDKALFVVNNISNETKRAVANLKNVKVVTPMHVNVVDLLKYGKVAINKEAVTQLQEVLVK